MTREEFDRWLKEEHAPCFPQIRDWLAELPADMREKAKVQWFRVLAPVEFESCCQASQTMLREPKFQPTYSRDFASHPSTILYLARKIDHHCPSRPLVTDEEREQSRASWLEYRGKLAATLGFDDWDGLDTRAARLAKRREAASTPAYADMPVKETVRLNIDECHEFWQAPPVPEEVGPVLTLKPSVSEPDLPF